MTYLLLQGSARALPLRDGSVQTCITSPPYWGLRSYAGEQREVWGGDAAHEHEWGDEARSRANGGQHDFSTSGLKRDGRSEESRVRTLTVNAKELSRQQPSSGGAFCACGAWYGALGLEPTPELYVAHIVEVMREVRRVLRDDGTLWIVIGDSYAASGRGGNPADSPHQKQASNRGSVLPAGMHESQHQAGVIGRAWSGAPPGLKPKDLVGIPWMVAFALRADGWYLRSDIVWAKPAPMPESVTDRPTKSHEYLFLLAKSQRYYYDIEAIREPVSANWKLGAGAPVPPHGDHVMDEGHAGRQVKRTYDEPKGANKRDVWTIATQPYPGQHFATFPEALVEPCILAGSRVAGKRCDCDEVIATPVGDGGGDDPTVFVGRAGFNRERGPAEGTRPITRREQRAYAEQIRVSAHRDEMAMAAGEAFAHYLRMDASGARPPPQRLIDDWRARSWLVEPAPCAHPAEATDIVLDPFNGSGTTGRVAMRHGRDYVGVDISREYLGQQALARIDPIAATGAATRRDGGGQSVLGI